MSRCVVHVVLSLLGIVTGLVVLFLPSHIVGVLSLVVLAVAILAAFAPDKGESAACGFPPFTQERRLSL